MCKAWDDHWKSGERAGREQGIEVFIQDKIDDGVDEECIVNKLVFRFRLTDKEAKEYVEKYR